MNAAERVVHGLARDGADLCAHDAIDVVGGAVRSVGDGSQNCQALGGDVDAMPAKQRIVVDRCLPRHAGRLERVLEQVQI